MLHADFAAGVKAASLTAVLALALQGCASTLVGSTVSAGAAATEERGLGGAVSDTEIRTRINALWSARDERMWRKVELQIYKGRVLLTGMMDSEEMRAEAARLAWRAKGVREVINEIQIGEAGVGKFLRDTKISAELKSKLLLDLDVASLNYSVTTTNGTVYLIGSARSQRELDLVTEYARNVGGVRKVVSYVEVAEPKRP